MSKIDSNSEIGSPYERILTLLSCVKRQPVGGALAQCPAHNDERASLKVDEGGDGRVLLFCHAGCANEAILKSIGLTMRDLFPNKRSRSLKSVKIVAAYDYFDSTGKLLYQSVRYDPKGFKLRRPDGRDGWNYKLDGVERSLYRLPELLSSNTDEWVFVLEGEKDVDALTELGFVATTNSEGAGKFRAELAKHFNNRRVAILPDNDDAGRAHSIKVASLLSPVAREVKIVSLASQLPKGDVSDWLEAGGDRVHLIELVAAAPKYDAETARPIIMETGEQHQVVAAKAFRALQRNNNNPVRLVRFAGGLSRLERNESGEYHIVDLSVHRLREELIRAADWVDAKFRPRVPSVDFGHLLLATSEPPLPVVTRFARGPVYTKDGRLLQEAGLDEPSGIYLLPHPFKLGDIPLQPTASEVRAACCLLIDDLLHDFPFATAADRANALAIPLERLAREMIDGPLPISAVEASAPGSGKGLLVSVLNVITNTSPPIWPEVVDDNEIRKALTAFLAAGVEVVLMDNLRHPLTSGTIAAAVTAPYWEDRMLGTNRLVRAKVRCSWIVTANNLSASAETLRRCSRIRLVPACERPEERSNFRHPKLSEWVVEHRSELLRALITLVNHWLDLGGPAPSLAALGSFEAWSATIGGILECGGIGEFQGNRREFTAAADFETAPWRELIARWWKTYGSTMVLSRDLLSLAANIIDFPLRGENGRSHQTAFGSELRKWKDRILKITAGGEPAEPIDVQVILSPDKFRNAARWQLVQVKGQCEVK